MTRPSYHDPSAPCECYVVDTVNADESEKTQIAVVVPSDIWIDADQAERFAKGLLECAQWLRDNTASRAPLDIIAENLSDDERASPARLAKDAARIMAALAAEGFEIVRKPD